MRLRTLLLISFSVTLLAPMTVIFGVSELYIQKNIRMDAESTQQEMSSLIMRNLRAYVDNSKFILTNLKEQITARMGTDSLAPFLEDRVARIDFLQAVILLSAEGRILTSVPQRPDLTGISLASAFSLTTITNDDVNFRPAAISLITSKATVTAVTRISGGGFIVFEYALEPLNSQFQPSEAHHHHHVLEITDQTGTLIASPVWREVLERRNIRPLVRTPGHARAEINGDYWVTYVTPFEDTGWHVLLRFSEKSIFATSQLLRQSILVTSAVTLALMAITLLFILGSMTRSLENLQRQMKGLSDQAAPRLLQKPIFAIREYDALNHKFNELAEVVAHREDDIRSAYQRFDTLVNNIPGVVYRVRYGRNGERNIEYVSPQSQNILGVPYKNLLDSGLAFEEMLLQEDRESFQKAERQALETGKPLFWSGRALTPKGLTHIQISSRRHKQEPQQVWDGVVSDISDQVRLQEALIQGEKMTMIGGLAAGMAHEIHNPLSAILQSVETLELQLFYGSRLAKALEDLGIPQEKMSALAEAMEWKTTLELLKESGLRAGRIVKDMLDFSRRDEGDMAETDIVALARKSEVLVRASLLPDLRKKAEGVQFVYRAEKNLTALCVPGQMEQVFINLFKNAIDALLDPDHGKPSVHPLIQIIGTTEEDGIKIDVIDNGPGIPETIRRRIFEPFFTTKSLGKGTGLGLSVSYFIVVKNHGGRMDVESQPRAGTKFTMRLPSTRAK